MFQPNYQIQEKNHNHWHMERFHFHEHCEFLLPQESHGTLYIGDQNFPLGPHTLFFLGANTLHRSSALGNYTRVVLHIGAQTLATFSTYQTNFTKLTQAPFRQAQLSPPQITEINTLFRAVMTHPNNGSFGSDIQQTMALLELLVYLTPLFQLSPQETQAHSKDFLRITPILDYIQENLAEPLNLDGLSSAFYLSKHYLCRIFKSTTGFSVMEYIIHCRIAKARQLLQEGYSVQRAGELSGFSDNSHFIRTFGKLTGVSPGKYTKSYQQSDHITIT